jgi:hypothetical protein
MTRLVLAGALLLLAACGRSTPPPAAAAAAGPVGGPIGIGEQLKADLRRQNAAQQARRAQIEGAAEPK